MYRKGQKHRLMVSRSYYRWICEIYAQEGDEGLDDYAREVLEAGDHDMLNIYEDSRSLTRPKDE